LRFYASRAPEWWPYHVVSLASRRRRARDGWKVLLDNGMFTWYRRRTEPPEIGPWLRELARAAESLAGAGDVEVVVVLPDWPYRPDVTVAAARDSVGRRICEEFACLFPVHVVGPEGPAPELLDVVTEALEAGAGLAAPTKLYCTRPGAGRRIPDRRCQVRLVRAVTEAIKHFGASAPVHAFAPTLSPPHILTFYRFGVSSFDTNSWTRPVSTRLRRRYNRSAKTREELEEFFVEAVTRLAGAGIPIENAQLALRRRQTQ